MNFADFEKIKSFKKFKKVKLAYVFGSHARGDAGQLSDYDFAIFLDEKNPSKRFELKLEIMAELSRELKTDKIDCVILNDAGSPELKYNIIQEGVVIYEKEPYRVLLEPKILNEYFDFYASLKRYGLTKA